MGIQYSHLYLVSPEKLEEFVQSSLRPPEDSARLIEKTLGDLCAVLQDTQALHLEKPVARGGSYGRQTVLRDHCDGTLVLFVSDWKRFQDQKDESQRHRVLDRVQEQLRDYQCNQKPAASVQVHRLGHWALTVQLVTRHQSVTFDVLPAFDALGSRERPIPETYRALKSCLDKTGAKPGEFSACFTELQLKFFDSFPRKLRDLMLLLKCWCCQCQGKLPASSPPLYALELLTAYAWEQGCSEENFDMAEGVRTVLGLIRQQEQLCVYWTVNYDFKDETVRNVLLNQLRSSPKPVILDPTDPTNNVSKDTVYWQMLKQEAQYWLSALHVNGSPGPSWNVLPVPPLFMTPGHLLDKFIKDFLQPNKDFLEQVTKAIDIISEFLKRNCFRNSTTKIQKIIKGGSSGKGTALKNGSDADLVVFPTSIKSYTSQKNDRSDIINEIRKQLETCPQVKEKKLQVAFEVSKWKAPRVLSFSLKSQEFKESVNFDVLPAFDALGPLTSGCGPRPKVYTELICLYQSSGALPGEFSTCFTELQRDFIISRPTKLKDLIRLVKYWYKQCERKLRQKASLPPKYALELLTIYAWEQGSGAHDFDTAEGFRAVLDLVTQYHQLCVFWTVNYSFEAEPMRSFLLTQIQKCRPVILDPAEPTGDVGRGNHWCWHLLAREAKEWLDNSPCFTDGAGKPVQAWKVPTVQTPGSCGIRIQPVISGTFSLRSQDP